MLHLAVTLLNMYIQANYTGPGLEETFPSISTISPFPWFGSVVPSEIILMRSPAPLPRAARSLRTLCTRWTSTARSPTR